MGGWGGFSCIHIEKFSKINTVNYGIFYYTFNLKYMYILLMYEHLYLYDTKLDVKLNRSFCPISHCSVIIRRHTKYVGINSFCLPANLSILTTYGFHPRKESIFNPLYSGNP